jgi:hypothetical protein
LDAPELLPPVHSPLLRLPPSARSAANAALFGTAFLKLAYKCLVVLIISSSLSVLSVKCLMIPLLVSLNDLNTMV